MLLQQDDLHATNPVAITKQSAKYNKLRNGNRRRRVKWAIGTATSTIGHALKTMKCSRATSPSLLKSAAMRNALHQEEEAEPLSATTEMPMSHRCRKHYTKTLTLTLTARVEDQHIAHRNPKSLNCDKQLGEKET